MSAPESNLGIGFMANDTDSDEFLSTSNLRTGMKREYAFALKYQSQISGSLGRTRAKKNAPIDDSGSRKSSRKKLKRDSKHLSEEETEKSDVVDEISENELKFLVVESDSGKEMKNDIVRHEEQDLKSNLVEVTEGKSDLVDRASENEAKNVVLKLKNGEKMNDVIKHVEDELKSNGVTLKDLKHDDMELVTEGGTMAEHVKPEKVIELERGEELKDDNVNNEEGLKSNALKLIEVISDNESVNNVVDSPTIEDLKHNDSELILESVAMVEQLNTEKVEFVAEVGNSYEFPVVVETPLRRFTRSALKTWEKLSEVSLDTEMTEVSAGEEEDGLESCSLLSSPPQLNVLKRLNKFPSKLKDFLDTGLLESVAVKYVRGSKSRGLSASGLQGVIKGSGILCFCHDCKGKNVIAPNNFELHAGSSNKRPPEYIYLENGKTLSDIMSACRNASPDQLEETFQLAVGCASVKMSSICLYCRGSIPEDGSAKCKLLCNLCVDLKNHDSLANSTRTPRTMSACDRSSRSFSIPVLSGDLSTCSSSRYKSNGKITKKDLGLHKLVFEEDFLPDGSEVAYFVHAQKYLVGYKQGSGILCSCCNSEISPSQFEAHAGFAQRRKPFHNIYVSNGASLHELAVSLSKGRKFTTKDNDDLCTICHDGGDLMCCDGCPRAFHTECVSLTTVPTGKWYCKNCQNNQNEKFEHTENAKAAGRVAGVDPLEQIIKRSIRIVTAPGFEVGGCVLCRSHDFSNSTFGPETVMLCDQCEQEYHVGCLKDHRMQDLKALPEGTWFCSKDCEKIHGSLSSLVIHGEEDISNSLIDVIKQKHDEMSTNSRENIDIKWRLIRGKTASDESRVLLSNAVAIFHERFGHISDSTSNQDLIPAMVYGRKIKGRDFGGMYCAVLTVNSMVVSAGIVRIYGPELAELPLVATSNDHQGKGYFQSLFSCIEGLLGSVNVKNLVVPAADEAASIWTSKFCFNRMSVDEISKYSKLHELMNFQEISWLQKSLPHQ